MVTWLVARATRPSTMSKMPAPMMTSPAIQKQLALVLRVSVTEQDAGDDIDAAGR